MSRISVACGRVRSESRESGVVRSRSARAGGLWLVGALLLGAPAVVSGQDGVAGDRAALAAFHDATAGANWSALRNREPDQPGNAGAQLQSLERDDSSPTGQSEQPANLGALGQPAERYDPTLA